MEEWEEEACLSGTPPFDKGELELQKVVPSVASQGDAAWGSPTASA